MNESKTKQKIKSTNPKQLPIKTHKNKLKTKNNYQLQIEEEKEVNELLGITNDQRETESKNTMNTKPTLKKLKSEVNLQVGEMKKDLKETIDNTIQAAIATGMEKLSQSTAAMVQEMFVGFAKQSNHPQPPANKKTQCQSYSNSPNDIGCGVTTEEQPKPSESGYIKPSTSGHVKSSTSGYISEKQKMELKPSTSGHVQSPTSGYISEKQKKEVEFSKFSRGKNFQTRIKSIQLRMKMVGSKDDMKSLFRNLTQEVNNDLEEYNMELCRFTIDENPELDGRCCKFYQFNGCPHVRICKEQFIHSLKWNNNRQNDYSNRNQNTREQQRTFGNTETNFFIHACSLCLSLRKGYGHHPLFKCELLIELDNIAQDPGNYVPVLMVPKKAKIKIRTIKTDPLSNPEDNIVSPPLPLLLPPPLPLPLPTIQMRPNRELLRNATSKIKQEVFELDD